MESSIIMRVLGTLVLMLLSVSAGAVSFSADIDQSKWGLEASKFNCRLSQQIPLFGEGVFDHEAGEAVRFTLKPLQGHGLKGSVLLMAEASPWQPGLAVRQIGEVKFVIGSGEIKVLSDYARQMLAALFKGMQPAFLANNWSGTGESVRIGLSAANFQPAYEAYAGCIAGLLPVNYRQIARTAVLFPSASATKTWVGSERRKSRHTESIATPSREAKILEVQWSLKGSDCHFDELSIDSLWCTAE